MAQVCRTSGAVPPVHVIVGVVGTVVAQDVHAVAPDVGSHIGSDAGAVVALPATGGLVDDPRRV